MFRRLEHLELDVRFCFGPPVTKQLRDMLPEEYRAHAYSTGWNAAFIPSLADILPPTIKSLRVVAGAEREDPSVIKRLFAELDARGAEYMPLLESVTVHRATSRLGSMRVAVDQDSSVWNSAREAVTSVGFEYRESADAEASWLEDFRQQYPRTV